jgi:hypothetical protein
MPALCSVSLFSPLIICSFSPGCCNDSRYSCLHGSCASSSSSNCDYSGSSAVAQPITLYDHALFSIYILKKDPSQNYKLKYPFVDNLPTAK